MPNENEGDNVRSVVAVDLDEHIAGVADLVFELVVDNLRRLSDAEPMDGQAWSVAAAVLSGATQRAALFAIRHGMKGAALAQLVQRAARLSADRTTAEIRAGS